MPIPRCGRLLTGNCVILKILPSGFCHPTSAFCPLLSETYLIDIPFLVSIITTSACIHTAIFRVRLLTWKQKQSRRSFNLLP